jgi:alpha-tubulin suppressor-like RCC1 family protein
MYVISIKDLKITHAWCFVIALALGIEITLVVTQDGHLYLFGQKCSRQVALRAKKETTAFCVLRMMSWRA